MSQIVRLLAFPCAARARHQAYRLMLSRRRHGGAMAIVFALVLVVLIGFIGITSDACRVYNRTAQPQGIANAAAVAAARQLNGTSAEIGNAAGTVNQRVPKMALLSCPVAQGALASATGLAIGKLMMTVPTTWARLYPEFGWLAMLQGAVELSK